MAEGPHFARIFVVDSRGAPLASVETNVSFFLREDDPEVRRLHLKKGGREWEKCFPLSMAGVSYVVTNLQMTLQERAHSRAARWFQAGIDWLSSLMRVIVQHPTAGHRFLPSDQAVIQAHFFPPLLESIPKGCQ